MDVMLNREVRLVQELILQHAVKSSYLILQDEQEAINLRSSSLTATRLYCRIDFDNSSNKTSVTFNHKKRFFLLSAGNNTTENVKFDRVSFTQISLSEHKSFTKPSRVLLQLHGSIMIVAWLGCCALSTLFPMHYKRCFGTMALFRKDVWFAVSCAFDGVTIGLSSGTMGSKIGTFWDLQ